MFKRVFKAFHYRDFRLMWIGACTSSIGTWMQKAAQSWLVLQLSGSPFLLGLDAFLGQIPILLFSLVGGVVADRMDRRLLLVGSQIVQMGCAFLLTVLFAFDRIEVWHILALSFVAGLAQAFGGPAYQALIPTLVDPPDLQNAIALNSIQFNLARVIGPALGGIALVKLGPSWCFGLNGVSFIAVIITLVMISQRFVPAKTTESMLESMKEGIRFIKRTEAMLALTVIAFLMTMLGIPMIEFLPVFVKDVFQRTSDSYTLMLSISGAGSVVGALLVAGLGHVHRKGLVALCMLVALGALMTAFSLSRWFWFSCLTLFLGGAALIAVFAMISSLVQMITSDAMRGRVMSVYNLAFRGGMPIGSLATGALTPVFSAPVVVACNGFLLVCLGLYFLIAHRRVATL